MVMRAAILVLSFLLTTPCLIATTEATTNERSESTELIMAGSCSLMVKRIFQKVETSHQYRILSGASSQYEASRKGTKFKDIDLHILLRRLII